MDIPLPEQWMQSAIGKTADADEYLEVGRTMKEDILLYTKVRPTMNVLDVGCGSGRTARHFVDYIRQPGRYVGMDIMKPFVDWCETHIASANPAFSFYHQDIYNGFYNPEGEQKASEYVFPFEDETFDLIILTSVFTHLLPEDALNYLKEIRRLLKPDGRCFSTWLLLGHDVDTRYMGFKAREGKVGYGFRRFIGMLEQCGLTLVEEPELRRWRDQRSPFRLQDLLLLGRSVPGEEGRLLARYETPALPEGDDRRPETNQGTVLDFDPVANALTLSVKGEREVFLLASDTVVRANRQRADSSALRENQRARVRFVRRPEKIALEVVVRDQPKVETVAGVIASVDPDQGHVTLISDREFVTLELDPERVRVRVNDEVADAKKLRAGQRASFRYVPRALAISSRDTAYEDRDDATDPESANGTEIREG